MSAKNGYPPISFTGKNVPSKIAFRYLFTNTLIDICELLGKDHPEPPPHPLPDACGSSLELLRGILSARSSVYHMHHI